MALYIAVIRWRCDEQSIDGIKTRDELTEIGRRSNNKDILFHICMGQMYELFYYRDYIAIMELCEKHPPTDYKRMYNTVRCFFEGISALNMARQQPNQPKYRMIGENSVRAVAKFKEINKWNFENKYLLLQAELHHLNGDNEAAESAYVSSIESARAHKLIHEEAKAYELFGAFCLERNRPEEGTKHLLAAVERYEQWGATNVAADLMQVIGELQIR